MRADTVLLIVLLLAGLANVALSIRAGWHARGFRRLLAVLPLVALLGVGLNIIAGVSRDPTSHNLWPLELLIVSGLGLMYSLAFMGLRGGWSRKGPGDERGVNG